MRKISDYDDCGHKNFYEFGRCLYKYTDCGPWVVAVLPGGREVYYENKEARDLPMDTEVQCLRVGSIVEGSETYVGPYDVEDPKDFDETVKQINDECSFYWERDNLDHFIVRRGEEYLGGLVCGWGECTFAPSGKKKLASRTLAKLKKYCTHGDYCIPCEDIVGGVHSPSSGDKFKVPGTRLVIEFFEDDCCY